MRSELALKIVKMISLDKKLLQLKGQQKIAKDLCILHGGVENEKQLYKTYIAKKIATILPAVMGVVILLLILWMTPKDSNELNGNSIMRNGYDGTEKSISLVAKSEGLEEDIEILIEPVHYSKGQLDEFAKEVFERIPEEYFCSEKVTGEGVYVIKNHIYLPSQIEGYPFELTWESSDYEVMEASGAIVGQDSDSPGEVILTAVLSCYEYTWEKEYAIRVYDDVEVWENKFSKKVVEVIEELDNSTAEEAEMILPTEIDGHKITYEEKGENSIVCIGGLGVLILIILWILPDNNISKQTEERNKQLLVDYAKFVSKLTLYTGAGLSFRTTVAKIVEGADKSRFYAKELEIVLRELENGISEQRAIDRLAERCKIPCYIKLSVLMNQNIRKGNNNLQKQLKEEMDKAFEERKNLARKYGEEAGTKLLFPMIMMLLVVIVMIMYPAFVSFTI